MKILKYCLWIPLFCALSTFAQQSPGKDITGKVANGRGEPLSNANVSLKNGRGTVTNARGQFLLKNVAPDDILQISFVGYNSQTIPIKNEIIFNITLSPAENELDRVVVQGYGITSDRLRTGSIEKITSEQISKQPVMNVLNVLQGQTPGAVVTNASGYASGTIKVEIRGRNTISPGFPSEPLYIIDGVPLTILDIANQDNYQSGSQGVIRSGIRSPASGQSPLFNLNPADIESVEVLKDADATAIYGSRASNGVVLITTKRGKTGKATFDINISQGAEKITSRYKVLDIKKYIVMRKEALSNDGLSLNINTAPDLVAWDTTKNTDWQNQLYGGIGNITDVLGTLSGGNAQTTFRIGAGYRYQTDILAVKGANKRGNFSINLNHKSLNEQFGVSFSAQYSHSNIDIISSPGAALLPPNAPDIYGQNGRLNYSGWSPLGYFYPFSNLLQPYESGTDFLNSSLDLSFEIAKGLTLKSNIGYSKMVSDQTNLQTIAAQDPIYNPTGTAYFGNTFIRNLIIEPQIIYNTFIGKNKISAIAGASMQSNETVGLQIVGSGYNNDVLLASVNAAPVKFSSTNKGEYKYAAMFARVNYNFKNKYIINLNARRDGSSRFGPGSQYGNFGSIGSAWIFSEESWIKRRLSFLSFGKIRGSYGLTGGDQISDYSYLSQWSFPGSTLYSGIVPLIVTRHTDSLLQWQKNKKLEISLSIGLFKERVSIEVNWYRHRCDNQLVLFPTPLFTGFPNVTSNSPANVQNSGYEIILNSKIFDRKQFKWDFKFNISANRNKLLSYPNFSESPYVSQLTIGKSINVIKLLHYTGVDPQTGLYQFEDKNKDGSITIDYSGKTVDDRYDLDRSPKFDGGFTNSLSYKNWELTVFFYFKKQIGQNAFTSTDPAGALSGLGNQSEEVFNNHWQKPGDIAKYPKFTTMPYDISFQNFRYNSDGIFTDASFLRLQNVTVSYSLSEKDGKKVGLKKCKFYLSAQNLLLFTKFKGSDPELQSFGSLPIPKILTAGISCQF